MALQHFALTAMLLTAPALCQQATDTGLMMGGGILTVIYGQDCGPFSCQPFHAGPTGSGIPYNVHVFGAPNQPYVLAADILPATSPCVSFPGIANALLLINNPVTLDLGLIGPASTVGTCYRGRATYTLQFPNGTPPGVTYYLQGLTMSSALQMPAFTVAIRSTTA